MSKKTLEAHEFSLKDVFCDKYEFEIPKYQRPYSWGEEQAETLVDDLLQFLAEQPDNILHADPYFLGSIVLIKSDNIARSQVVDGQQRLTTLTLLMSVLRKLAHSDVATDLETRIFQKGNTTLLTSDKSRLKIRDKDQHFFLKYIQKKDKLDELFSLKETLNDSQEKIKKNTTAIHNKLHDYNHELLARLSQFLMLGCYIVVVTTPDVDSAYRIFSVMNDRGLDLSATDILKSHITGSIPEADGLQDNYTTKWEDIEEQVGRDNFTSLFSHIRMLEMRSKSKSNVVSDFKKEIQPEKKPKKFIDDKLVPYAKAFSEILDERFTGNEYQNEIDNSFSWLNRIDNSDWVPTAIYYISKYRQEPNRVNQFLRLLERLASVQMINRISVNYRIARYASILKEIDEGTELEDNSKVMLSRTEKDNAIEQLNGPLYQIRQIRLMVLLRLDSELSDGTATYNPPRTTIEHVMPQNPSEGSQWKTWCPTDKEHEELVHTIGNLALLSQTKNIGANNYEFDKKKTAYFNDKEGHSAFKLTSQIIGESEWTPTIIRKRQAQLVNKLIQAWDLE